MSSKLILNIYNIFFVVFFSVFRIYCLISGKNNILKTKTFNAIASKNNNKQYLWIHASSVGESVLSFAIIKQILLENPNYNLIVTTHTVTSKKLWEKEFNNEFISGRVTHYYLPFDIKSIVKKFINYYNFKLVLWIESDFWPNYLQQLKTNNIPIILLNGRMSKRSFQRWGYLKFFIRSILNNFTIIFPDSNQSYQYFKFFSPNLPLYNLGNLKYIREVPKIDLSEYEIIKSSLANRKAILALSTHSGEELMFANLHIKLRNKFPNLLTIILPRHIDRTNVINKQLQVLNLSIQRFSENIKINSNTDIYIVDELDKVYLFSSIVKLAYIGKTMFDYNRGGHNLLEPLSVGCTVIFGKYMDNFIDIAKNAIDAKIAIQVNSPIELEQQLTSILDNSKIITSNINKAKEFVITNNQIKLQILNIINNYL
ncbi:3-deoxy-D-manno-octulosonic acid transferase [Rickettsiales bacterium LUAb2]